MKVGKDPWQIAASRFCVEQGDKEFTYTEVKDFLRKEGYKIHDYQVQIFLDDEIGHPPGMQFGRNARIENNISFWTAPLNLVSTINDYDELRLARDNARSAWRWAAAAFFVSSIGAVFQILQYLCS